MQGALDRAAFDRLVGALSLCIGIEAHVTLRDVCGFTETEARNIKTWAAAALVDAATARLVDRSATEPVGVPKRGKR